jgi:hypothetical protein
MHTDGNNGFIVAVSIFEYAQFQRIAVSREQNFCSGTILEFADIGLKFAFCGTAVTFVDFIAVVTFFVVFEDAVPAVFFAFDAFEHASSVFVDALPICHIFRHSCHAKFTDFAGFKFVVATLCLWAGIWSVRRFFLAEFSGFWTDVTVFDGASFGAAVAICKIAVIAGFFGFFVAVTTDKFFF